MKADFKGQERMQSLGGRVALVTGASRGIGRAIAVTLAQAGAKVALNHHPSMDAAEIAASRAAVAAVEGTSIDVYADVSDPEDARQMVQRVLDEWGQIDILVNNAGITRDRTIRKLTVEDWRAVIDVDLSSVFYCTSAVVPSMIEKGYGRIISISSIVAETGNYGQANYAAAKAGILGFTKTVALELAKHGITANAVCPGFTETSMTAAIPANVLDQIRGRVPLGRLAKPEEIARAVLYLAADGDYVTGQQLNVNGGLYM
jgi:acetoacetyl-CoA reductase